MNYIRALVCLPQTSKQVGNSQTEIQQNFYVLLLLCKSDKGTYPNECSELFTSFFALRQYILIEFQIPMNENT